MPAPETSLAQQVDAIERMVRSEARQALSLARDLLAEAPLEDDLLYERLRLAKGAAQARLGETADGARLMREVKAWAEDHDETELLAMSHRRLSMLFRRVGDPALMLEHAVTAVELLEDDCDPELRAEHLLGLADALGASGEYDVSIRRYQEARELVERCDDLYLRHAVLNNLAFTLYEAGLRRGGGADLGASSWRRSRPAASPMLTHIGGHRRACLHVRRSLRRRRRRAAAALRDPRVRRGLRRPRPGPADPRGGQAPRRRPRHAGEALDRASNLIEKFSLEGHRASVLREQGELFAAARRLRVGLHHLQGLPRGRDGAARARA